MERNRSHLSAVIFDYGHVLSEAQVSSDIEAMARLLELDSVPFQEAYWEFRVAYDEAKLSPETYWQAVADAARRTVTPDQMAALRRLDMQSWLKPNRPMVGWAGRLQRAGLKTAVLSNMPVDLYQNLMGPASWLPKFDHVTFSCEVGCSKPDPEIYRHCLEGLAVKAADALFLDDREPNVQGARLLGMHALLFTDVNAAVAELEGQFDLPSLREAVR